jgi:tetratricopeptide (TPR) repeat protein
MSLRAAAAVLDLPPEDTEDLLESLVDTSLLESAAPGRYRFHDLVRLYARACAERDERPASERGAALSRVLDFYLATTSGVYAIERPGDRLVHDLEPTEYPGARFVEGTTALDWLYTEAAPLLACVQQAAGTDRMRRAVDLLWAAKDLTESGANSRQYETTAKAMCDATRAAGDLRAEGRARTVLTDVLLVSGRIQQAEDEARLAMELAASVEDSTAVSWVANNRGLICLHQHRYAEGKVLFDHAIDGFRAAGNKPGEASALSNLSRAQLGVGDIAAAVEIAQHGLALYLEMGRTMRLANGHFAVGVALTRAGRHSDALDQFSEALGIFGEHRQRLWEGATNYRIAEAHMAALRPTRAAQHAEQALALGSIGGDRMRGNILTLLGRALTELGQPDRAKACWREALNLLEQNGASEVDDVRALLTSAPA